MGRELRRVQVSFTTHKSEHLPMKDGEQMYADDVAQEVSDVVSAALTSWYAERGAALLSCEPDVF